MSLIFAIILIAIAWLMSLAIDAIPHLWNWLSTTPLWLMAIFFAGLLAWLGSDP